MSMGPLLVLVLAMFSLSEGRIMSRCELRDQLGGVVQLPQRLQRIRDRVLARVICEVERFSYLDTNFVREFHKETVVLDETTTSPTSSGSETSNPIPTLPEEQTIETPTTPTIPTTTTTPAQTTTTTNTTTAPTSPTTTKEPSHTSQHISPDTTLPTNANDTSNSSVVARRKREASEIKDEEMEVTLKRGKRANIQVWSVGFYGIFQLSDRVFCESGYHASENKCLADCYAFSDNDISDDVECFVMSGRFWEVFRKARSTCKSRKTTDVFFDDCNNGEEYPSDRNRWRTWLSWSANSYK